MDALSSRTFATVIYRPQRANCPVRIGTEAPRRIQKCATIAGARYSALMRQWLVALMALMVPSVTAAQTTGLDAPSGLPLPSIGLPLPSIGLSHPATGLPPLASGVPGREPAGAGERRGEHRHRGGTQPVAVFVSPWFLAVPATAVAAPALSSAASTAPPADGRVLVEAQPDSAQIYVDGYYVGTPSDYPDGVQLAAGPHTLEVRAAGHDSQSMSIQVPRGRSISYRAVLTAATPPSSALPRPAATMPTTSGGVVTASTFYLIHGCYMGNVPPSEAPLPPGCDPAKAVAVRP